MDCGRDQRQLGRGVRSTLADGGPRVGRVGAARLPASREIAPGPGRRDPGNSQRSCPAPLHARSQHLLAGIRAGPSGFLLRVPSVHAAASPGVWLRRGQRPQGLEQEMASRAGCLLAS